MYIGHTCLFYTELMEEKLNILYISPFFIINVRVTDGRCVCKRYEKTQCNDLQTTSTINRSNDHHNIYMNY